jgi:hypothetical protein
MIFLPVVFMLNKNQPIEKAAINNQSIIIIIIIIIILYNYYNLAKLCPKLSILLITGRYTLTKRIKEAKTGIEFFN